MCFLDIVRAVGTVVTVLLEHRAGGWNCGAHQTELTLYMHGQLLRCCLGVCLWPVVLFRHSCQLLVVSNRLDRCAVTPVAVSSGRSLVITQPTRLRRWSGVGCYWTSCAPTVSSGRPSSHHLDACLLQALSLPNAHASRARLLLKSRSSCLCAGPPMTCVLLMPPLP